LLNKILYNTKHLHDHYMNIWG